MQTKRIENYMWFLTAFDSFSNSLPYFSYFYPSTVYVYMHKSPKTGIKLLEVLLFRTEKSILIIIMTLVLKKENIFPCTMYSNLITKIDFKRQHRCRYFNTVIKCLEQQVHCPVSASCVKVCLLFRLPHIKFSKNHSPLIYHHKCVVCVCVCICRLL